MQTKVFLLVCVGQQLIFIQILLKQARNYISLHCRYRRHQSAPIKIDAGDNQEPKGNLPDQFDVLESTKKTEPRRSKRKQDPMEPAPEASTFPAWAFDKR